MYSFDVGERGLFGQLKKRKGIEEGCKIMGDSSEQMAAPFNTVRDRVSGGKVVRVAGGGLG